MLKKINAVAELIGKYVNSQMQGHPQVLIIVDLASENSLKIIWDLTYSIS